MTTQMSDNRTCTEDHPCDRWGTCSQFCRRVSRKRHKCYCHDDFYLSAADGFSCKSKFEGPPLLIFTTRSEVRSVDLRSGMARPLLSGLKNAVAIDFLIGDSGEPGSDSVFWADVQDDKIYRGSLIGKTISNVQVAVPRRYHLRVVHFPTIALRLLGGG